MLQYFYLLDYQLDDAVKPTYLLPIFDRENNSWSRDTCRLRRDLISDLANTTKDAMAKAINVAENLDDKQLTVCGHPECERHRLIRQTRDNIFLLKFEEASAFQRIHIAVKTLLANEKNKDAPKWQDANFIMTPMIHARVYALAEKYTMEGLKYLAKTKFNALHGHVLNEGFYKAIDIIFTSTPDSDMGLRKIVVRKLCFIINQYGVLPQIEEKLKMFPELVVQILDFQAGFHNLPSSWDQNDDY